MNLPHILALCCTYNRYSCLKRSLACFLSQDYVGKATLLIYNSGEPLELGDFPIPENREVILINNTIDKVTGKPYTNVGSKYRDALNSAPKADVVNSFDDDDTRLSFFLTDGVEGYLRAKERNKLAWKPLYSYFRYGNGIIERVNNTLEPSWFVDYEFLLSVGYLPHTVKYHDSWVLPLVQSNKVLVEDTRSSFIYNWGADQQVFKLSGGQDNYQNFVAHQISSQDTGSGEKLTPASEKEMSKYYKEIEEFNKQS